MTSKEFKALVSKLDETCLSSLLGYCITFMSQGVKSTYKEKAVHVLDTLYCLFNDADREQIARHAQFEYQQMIIRQYEQKEKDKHLS